MTLLHARVGRPRAAIIGGALALSGTCSWAQVVLGQEVVLSGRKRCQVPFRRPRAQAAYHSVRTRIVSGTWRMPSFTAASAIGSMSRIT